MVFNYNGKKFAEEEVSKRVELAKSEETDTNARLLIMNLSQTKLTVLNSLSEDIQQICDCFFLKKHMAALTLTNLLFETMIKLTLAYYDADGRTMDEEGVEFETILEKELAEYGKNKLAKNIECLFKKNVMTEDGYKRLLDLKDLFRNPYSHGSNNRYVESASTVLYEWQPGDKSIQERKVSVVGNPHLLLDARRTFVKQMGLGYFTEIVSYIQELDKFLHKLYPQK